MVAHGVKRIVFSSSAAVHGEPERLPLDEKNPVRPVSAYGETKLSFEKALRWYASGLRNASDGTAVFQCGGRI